MNQSFRVAVTGATGFVGRNLVDALEATGCQVTRVVRTRSRPEDVVVADITDGVPPEALRGHHAVVHLAAAAHRQASVDFFAVNRDGAIRTAQAALEANVAHFVFLSTAKVLGAHSTTPFDVDSPLNPPDDYSRAKAEAELEIAKVLTGKAVTIVRPPLVYGPGARGNVASLVKWANTGLPFPVPRQPNRRSIVLRDDLTSAILIVLRNPVPGVRVVQPHDGEPISFERMYLDFALTSVTRVIRLPTLLFRLGDRVLGAKKALLSPAIRNFELSPDRGLANLGWEPGGARWLD